MKSIEIIMVIVGSLLGLRNTFVAVDFLQDQTYIAQELCENKDKPELNCEGRCVLKKRMNALLVEIRNSQTEERMSNCLNFMFYFADQDEQNVHREFGEKTSQSSSYKMSDSEWLIQIQTPPPRV